MVVDVTRSIGGGGAGSGEASIIAGFKSKDNAPQIIKRHSQSNSSSGAGGGGDNKGEEKKKKKKKKFFKVPRVPRLGRLVPKFFKRKKKKKKEEE